MNTPRLLLLLAAAVISCPALAQTPLPVAQAAPTPAPGGPAPRIQWSTNTFDFGTLNAGEVRRAEFFFTNTGNAVLEITQVSPGCGCTTAGEWSRRVEPGQTGLIPLQFSSANFQGPVMKSATIVCNDPTQPTHQLHLKASVWKPMDVMPNFVMFNLNNESQTNEVRVVRITNNTGQPVEVSEPESGNPAFRAELKTVEAGKVFELHISPTAPFSPGTVQTVITAKTTSTNVPVVSVTALAMVQPPVVAVPAQVYLPPGPLANAMPMTVLVQNNSPDPISLSDATVSLENVTVKVNETQPGKVFSLTLSFPQGFELPAGRPGTLIVKTSHPRVTQLTVPVVQPPRPQPAYTTTGVPTTIRSAPPAAVPPPPPYLRAPPTPPVVPPSPPPAHSHLGQPTAPPLPPPPATPPALPRSF